MAKKWEYLIVDDPNEEELSRLGDEGWELVAVTEVYGSETESDPGYNAKAAYFKREKA